MNCTDLAALFALPIYCIIMVVIFVVWGTQDDFVGLYCCGVATYYNHVVKFSGLVEHTKFEITNPFLFGNNRN